MTNAQVKTELKRIAKVFRRQERHDARAAKKERDADCPVHAANYDGNASAMKYCAEHIESLLYRIR
jgi:hypothetical protein